MTSDCPEIPLTVKYFIFPQNNCYLQTLFVSLHSLPKISPMKTIRKFLLPVALMLIFIASCDKDDTKTTKDYLISKSCWYLSKAETQNPDQTWSDVTNLIYKPCDFDNCMNLKADGTFTVDEGATKCSPAAPQTNNQGTWSLSPDEKQIVLIDQNKVTTTYQIVNISAGQLSVTTNILGVQTRITFK